MTLKEQALARTTPPNTTPGRYHVPDALLTLVMLLGAQPKREVLRSRFRVLAAMQAQVREQGRYQGGRPPYGYRLADGGAHRPRTQDDH